jgi:hypothetical protein
MAVQRHPSTEKRFQEAAQRWMDLKKTHDAMTRLLWLGIMVANFTDDEFALLGDYLCENDRRYLLKAGRKVSEASR